jgi:hypothetical protein
MRFSVTLILIYLGLASLTAQTTAQKEQKRPGENISVTDDSLHTIKINYEMVNRFNNIKAPDGIYSWSQLWSGKDSRMVAEFIHTYHTCDLQVETLAGIKTTLDNTLEKIEKDDTAMHDEYLATIIKIKEEINQKIKYSDQTLVQK